MYIGNTSIITCGGDPTVHKCNENAICYDTNGDRFFFKDREEADKWYNDNYENVRSGSAACSICGRAVIDVD